MKAELRFETWKMTTGTLGTESCVPSFLPNQIVQNQVRFDLDEWDEIYEAYGRYYFAYPYRELNTYDRVLRENDIRTAVLENNYLKAVFLPDFGGRLWILKDKITGRDLLYTNDVIRYSNLSVRNAWFSGGVEWNIGVIGHTPMSTESLHTATIEDHEGGPVLRMYGYERIRGLEYQMDFWLGEKDTVLNCRMRVVNTGKEVVPVYWWSNMAVPEYKGGRVVVPAAEAFTCGKVDGHDQVHKVDIPMIDGIDISRYNDIKYQVDYFFHIPKESPKYIANLDSKGYGLLHMSTGRLRGRKLFSWGNNDGSDHWQEFLTDKAGRYLEIQAGLPQTQYGCLPLAPHTTWEWVEQYGSVQADESCITSPFEEVRSHMTAYVEKRMADTGLNRVLSDTKKMAVSEAKVMYYGKSYGTLKNLVRKIEGERSLSKHLEYGELEGPRKAWAEFLTSGIFMKQDALEIPGDFQCDELFYKKLKEAMKRAENQENWYAHYQLGVLHFYHQCYAEAKEEMLISLKLDTNPWAYHGLALLALLRDDKEQVREMIIAGIQMMKDSLSYVKEGFSILLQTDDYSDVHTLYHELPLALRDDTRIRYDYMLALADSGKVHEAFDNLMAGDGFVLDDSREGQDTLAELYTDLCEKMNGKKPDSIPHRFQFHAGKPVEI